MNSNHIKCLFLYFVLTIFSIELNAQIDNQISITKSGKYVLGCNYWASLAGINMWKDWGSDVVEADLKKISEAGMQVIRVFPMWPDFRPFPEDNVSVGVNSAIFSAGR